MEDADKYCQTSALIPCFPAVFPVFLFLTPSFSLHFLITSSCPPLSQPTLLSSSQLLIQHQSLQKSNLSNLSLAGPSTLCCYCLSGAPQMRCVIRQQREFLPGIKTDFCTLKSEPIKNNRELFVVQRECFSPSSIFPHSCTFSLHSVTL